LKVKFILLARHGKDYDLLRRGRFKSYREAVLAGQEYGHGNFLVETIGRIGEGYVPSREEQLLGKEPEREGYKD
jgi:hypothetical protein